MSAHESNGQCASANTMPSIPPRTSDSPPRTPTSPFLHSLSTRFRKGSNASSSVASDAHTANSPQDPTERAETAQSARRFLLSIIRDDWEFPTPNTTVVTEETPQDTFLAQREPLAYRTREPGPSDLDSDGESLPSSVRRRARRNNDPYRFENPDAILATMQDRKRKRKRQIEEETQWNAGLRMWCQQRDAWTGAIASKPTRRSFDHSRRGSLPQSPRTSLNTGRSKHQRISQDTTRSNDSDSHMPPLDRPLRNNASATAGPDSGQAASGSTLPSEAAPVEPSPLSKQVDSDAPYLPIYPPLFPTSHSLRSRIKPAAYPTIYSKVVIQSLTPNIPIPLTHMTGALVSGWKSEGNWPPQSLADQERQRMLESLAASTRGASTAGGNPASQKKETAFQRWREERKTLDKKKKSHHQHHHRNRQENSAAVTNNGMADVEGIILESEDHDDEEKRSGGLRKSISGAVKKVFGLNGDVEADGGLEKLGLHFGEHKDNFGQIPPGSIDSSGLLVETRKCAEDNLILNRGLIGAGGNE